MSKGEREITSKLITYKGESTKGEKEISKGERMLKDPKLIIKEREITSKAYHLQRRKY